MDSLCKARRLSKGKLYGYLIFSARNWRRESDLMAFDADEALLLLRRKGIIEQARMDIP